MVVMLTPIILMVVGIPGFFYSSNTQIPEDTIKIHAMRFPDFHLRQAVPEIFRPMLDCSPLKNGTRFYWYLGRMGGRSLTQDVDGDMTWWT